MSEKLVKQKPLCIYHGNWLDGFGAAWAVHHALGDNVADVAKQYGGGGHKNTAGFTVNIGWEGE